MAVKGMLSLSAELQTRSESPFSDVLWNRAFAAISSEAQAATAPSRSSGRWIMVSA